MYVPTAMMFQSQRVPFLLEKDLDLIQSILLLLLSAALVKCRHSRSSVSMSLWRLYPPLSHQPPACPPYQIHKPAPWSSSSPPAWWLHFQHSFLDIPCIPRLHMPKPSHLASLALSPNCPTCAVPPIYLFLILSILVTMNIAASSSLPLQALAPAFCQYHFLQTIQHTFSLYHLVNFSFTLAGTLPTQIEIPLCPACILFFTSLPHSPWLWTADPKYFKLLHRRHLYSLRPHHSATLRHLTIPDCSFKRENLFEFHGCLLFIPDARGTVPERNLFQFGMNVTHDRARLQYAGIISNDLAV